MESQFGSQYNGSHCRKQVALHTCHISPVALWELSSFGLTWRTKNQGTWAGNPNDVSHTSNGDQ